MLGAGKRKCRELAVMGLGDSASQEAGRTGTTARRVREAGLELP